MEKLKAFDVDLKRLFFEVLKRVWLIILVGVLCGGAVFAYAKFFITPQYTATASIYVQNYTGENDQKIYSSDISASQSLVATYSELITSNRVLEKVVAKLDNRYTADQIRSAFSAALTKKSWHCAAPKAGGISIRFPSAVLRLSLSTLPPPLKRLRLS